MHFTWTTECIRDILVTMVGITYFHTIMTIIVVVHITPSLSYNNIYITPICAFIANLTATLQYSNVLVKLQN